MINDLSQWNEYIPGDTSSAPVPIGVKLEIAQVVTATGYKESPEGSILSNLTCDKESVKIRVFWRLKE